LADVSQLTVSRAASTADRVHIVVHADRYRLVSSDARLSSAPRLASDDHACDGAPDVAVHSTHAD
jgi:hypothetical protein